MKKELKEKKKQIPLDSIKAKAGVKSEPTKYVSTPAAPAKGKRFSLIDNKIPQRGIIWYVIFAVLILIAIFLAAYYQDWLFLFFVVAFGGFTLLRSHGEHAVELEIGSESLALNGRSFNFREIDSYYFSRIGEDITVSFSFLKKYLPRITFILNNPQDYESIRTLLNDNLPENEPREERFLDLLIRKLKI